MSAREKQLFAATVTIATMTFLFSIIPFTPKDNWSLIIAPIGAALVIAVGFLLPVKKR